MNPVFFSLIFAAVVYGQGFTINTPNSPVECQPTAITWAGGTPPYFLSILPGNDPTGVALQNIGEVTGNSYTWPTNITAGTSIGLTIKDSTGTTAQSAAVTIQPGTSTACINGGGGSASGSSSSSAGTTSATSATTSATTPATTPATSATATSKAATTTATTPASSSSSSSGSSSTATGASGSSSKNAASANMANMGVAGVFGAAIIAILA